MLDSDQRREGKYIIKIQIRNKDNTALCIILNNTQDLLYVNIIDTVFFSCIIYIHDDDSSNHSLSLSLQATGMSS